MEGQLRVVEGEQELFPVGVDACEELVEDDDAGLASQAAVKVFFDLSPEGRPGLLGVRPEFAVLLTWGWYTRVPIGRNGIFDR